MQLLDESLEEGPQGLEQNGLEHELTALNSHVQCNIDCYIQDMQRPSQRSIQVEFFRSEFVSLKQR